jgi:hypothetical protein
VKLPAGRIKRLHVDRGVIDRNRKHGRNDPPLTVQTSRGSHKCHTAHVRGPSTFVYRPLKPLSSGARLWIETRAEVELEK